MSLVADCVTLSIRRRLLLSEVSLRIEAGTVHALLGPNGAGKSTLLRVLAAERRPDSGEATLEGRLLQDWPAAALARSRAVLSQDDSLRFALSVREMVTLGRLPYAPEAQANETRIAQAALSLCDATSLAERSYLTLSGGERTRVRLARVLAQVWEQFEKPVRGNPRYLLLDEPAAHLDIGHQHFAMQLLRRFATAGGGVLVTLHDPNLALAYADTASLIVDGRLRATGPVNHVLTPQILEPVYGLGVQLLTTADGDPLLAWGTRVPTQSSR